MKKLIRKWWFCAIIFGILILSTIVIFCITNNTKEVISNNNETYSMIGKEIKLTNKMKEKLYEKIKQDITNDLKTPASAIFPKMKDWSIIVNTYNIIEVKSYVDSQNSFGAILRSDFKQKYILLDNNNYLCIYKEFDNKTQFDITENSQYNQVKNKKLNDEEVDEILKGSSIIYTKMTYDFDEEKQELTLNIIEEEDKSYNIRTGVYSCIKTEIDQCFCMPTVKMNIIVKNENNEKLAEVRGIDLKFLINNWNSLIDVGISSSPSFENIEEKLEGKLWQNNRIKEVDLNYINTNAFYN